MTIEIPLTQGYVTRIDDADRVVVGGRKWTAQVAPHRNTVYAYARVDGEHVYLHGLLAPEWEVVDHADGDGLNNCRYNLRDGSGFRNRANAGIRADNTSGFKGVYSTVSRKWVAQVTVNGKTRCLGTYVTPEEAAHAYDRAAISAFGEYAKTNAMLGLL